MASVLKWLRRASWIAGAALTAHAAAGTAASGQSTTATVDEYATTADQNVEIFALLESQEFVWLADSREIGSIESYPGGAVSIAGFYPRQQITEARLDTFRKNLLHPDWLMVKRGSERIISVEVIWHKVPGTDIECGAIIQAISGENAAITGRSRAEVMEELRAVLPERPLDENCNYDPTRR